MSLERRIERLEALDCRHEIAEMLQASTCPPSVTVNVILKAVIDWLTLPADQARSAYPGIAEFEAHREELRRDLPLFQRARHPRI